MESLDGDVRPDRAFLSNRYKKVVLVKIELLRKLQDPSAIELLEGIAGSEKDEEVITMASQAIAALR